LLDWAQARLAEAAGILLSTVVKLERNGRAVRAEAVQAMKRALEAAGVVFFPEYGSGAGVKFRKEKLN
jgi:hypothetical protein